MNTPPPTAAALRARAARKADPAKFAALGRKWRREHPEQARAQSHKSRLKRLDKIKVYQQAWVQRNKDYLKKKGRAYYLENQTRIRHQVREYQLGLPKGTYAALLTRFGDACHICGKQPTNKALAIDHDHATGFVRGLLCCECNAGVGLLQDSLDVLKKAVSYLRKRATTNLLERVGLPGTVVRRPKSALGT